jgi:hypothetical protein
MSLVLMRLRGRLSVWKLGTSGNFVLYIAQRLSQGNRYRILNGMEEVLPFIFYRQEFGWSLITEATESFDHRPM